MTKITYSEKLKDPRWQKKRLQVLKRDKFTCCACGEKEKTLHVHHLYYVKGGDPWDTELDGLNTYCEDCHEFHHIKNIHPVIANIACLMAINPKKHGEVMQALVAYALEFYNNKKIVLPKCKACGEYRRSGKKCSVCGFIPE